MVRYQRTRQDGEIPTDMSIQGRVADFAHRAVVTLLIGTSVAGLAFCTGGAIDVIQRSQLRKRVMQQAEAASSSSE